MPSQPWPPMGKMTGGFTDAVAEFSLMDVALLSELFEKMQAFQETGSYFAAHTQEETDAADDVWGALRAIQERKELYELDQKRSDSGADKGN